MQNLMLAGAVSLLVMGSLISAAGAAGPRASSEVAIPAPTQSEEPAYNNGTAPHYVWQQGYDHGGKWRGHWVLVQ